MMMPWAEIHVGEEGNCICPSYVVDYSDPDRYHPENVDREDDPRCPVHGVKVPEIERGVGPMIRFILFWLRGLRTDEDWWR